MQLRLNPPLYIIHDYAVIWTSPTLRHIPPHHPHSTIKPTAEEICPVDPDERGTVGRTRGAGLVSFCTTSEGREQNDNISLLMTTCQNVKMSNEKRAWREGEGRNKVGRKVVQ